MVVPHHRVYAPYSLRKAVWVLLCPTRIRTVKELRDGICSSIGRRYSAFFPFFTFPFFHFLFSMFPFFILLDTEVKITPLLPFGWTWSENKTSSSYWLKNLSVYLQTSGVANQSILCADWPITICHVEREEQKEGALNLLWDPIPIPFAAFVDVTTKQL